MHSNHLTQEDAHKITSYTQKLALFISLISLYASLAIAQPHDVTPQEEAHHAPKTVVLFCGQELSIYTPEIQCDQAVGDWSPLTSFKNITWISLSGPAVNSLSSFTLLPTSLRFLFIEGGEVQPSWSPRQLSHLQHLETLTLSKLKDADRLSDLRPLIRLKRLNLYWLGITQLPHLPKTLVMMRASHTHLNDLTSIEHTPELTTLDLSYTEIESLQALRHLSKLTALNISQTQVLDLGPLMDLKALNRLDLRMTEITDFDPIKTLPNLHTVLYPTIEICGVEVSMMTEELACSTPLELDDYQRLTKLTALKTLRLHQVTRLLMEAVNMLRGLKRLIIYDIDHFSASQISQLTELTDLMIIKAESVNLRGVDQLSSLQEFRLSTTRTPVQLESVTFPSSLTLITFNNITLESTQALASIPSLVTLNLFRVRLPSLRFVNQLTALRVLKIYLDEHHADLFKELHHLSPELRDLYLKPLSHTTLEMIRESRHLESLSLAFHQYTRIALKDLPALTKLRSLSISNIDVSDAHLIGNFSALQELSLTEMRLDRIDTFGQLQRLTRLNLSESYLGDYPARFFSSLTQLTDLDLSYTRFSDLSLLSNLAQLTHLNLEGSLVSDLSSVVHLAQLKSLNVLNTQVLDLRPLRYLPHLNSLQYQFIPTSKLVEHNRLMQEKRSSREHGGHPQNELQSGLPQGDLQRDSVDLSGDLNNKRNLERNLERDLEQDLEQDLARDLDQIYDLAYEREQHSPYLMRLRGPILHIAPIILVELSSVDRDRHFLTCGLEVELDQESTRVHVEAKRDEMNRAIHKIISSYSLQVIYDPAERDVILEHIRDELNALLGPNQGHIAMVNTLYWRMKSQSDEGWRSRHQP